MFTALSLGGIIHEEKGNEFGYNSILAMNSIRDYKFKAYPLSEGLSQRNSPLESALVINAKSTHADRVLMFIDWLQSEQENYDLLMYGVQGKNYTDMGDYIIPAEVDNESDSFLNWGWRAPFRNIKYERANFPGLKEEVASYSKVIEEKTKYPPSIGFTPDYSSVSDIITMRMMGYSNMDRSVYTGILGESDVEDFIKEQKNNGVQKLVDVVQKQLDEYTKNK